MSLTTESITVETRFIIPSCQWAWILMQKLYRTFHWPMSTAWWSECFIGVRHISDNAIWRSLTIRLHHMTLSKMWVNRLKLLIDFSGIRHQIYKTKAEEHTPNKLPLLNDKTAVTTEQKPIVLIPYYAWANRAKAKCKLGFRSRCRT